MNYPDDWVFEFDQETLTSDFDTIRYVDYLEGRQPTLKKLKEVTLSFSEYESEIQKVLLNQYQLLHSFFNTEVLCNEHSYFQDFSQIVVKFLEVEILYGISFWVFGSLKQFVRHRVNSSIARTLKFLAALQINVLEKYHRDRNYSFFNENEPEKDSLTEYLEDLYVDYQQLNTMIVYLRKSYAELYSKLQSKNIASSFEMDMIGKVIMYCKVFFMANPKAILKVIGKVVPENVEREVVFDILRVNEVLRKEVIRKKNEYISPEMEKKKIEDYVLKQFSSTFTFKKMISDVDKHYKHPIYEEEMVIERRKAGRLTRINFEGGAGDGDQSPSPDVRKRNMTLKLGDGLKEAYQKAQFEGGNTKDILQREESKKDANKDNEKKDLLSLLNNTANSPAKNNRYLPPGVRFSQLDYQFNKGIKHSDSLNGSSPYLFAEEPKLKREMSSFILNDLPNDLSDLSELQDNVFENEQLEDFLKDQINEEYLTSMSKVTIEPKKLSRIPGGDKVFQSENRIGGLFNRGAAANKKKLAGNTFGSIAHSNSIRKDNMSDDQGTQLSRRTSGVTERDMLQPRGRKKLGTFFDKSFNSLATMQMADVDPNAAKEERGPDLPDDELIGNLVGDDPHQYLEDSDEEEYEEGERSPQKKNVGQKESEHNKFVDYMRNLKEQRQMLHGYHRLARFNVNLGPEDNVDRTRRRNAWSHLYDRKLSSQVLNDMWAGLEEEDPTFGLNITIRSLDYLSRMTIKGRTGAVNFHKLVKS